MVARLLIKDSQDDYYCFSQIKRLLVSCLRYHATAGFLAWGRLRDAVWARLAGRSIDSIATVSNCLHLAKNTLDVVTNSATITHKTNSICTSSSILFKRSMQYVVYAIHCPGANSMPLGYKAEPHYGHFRLFAQPGWQ
jgi:hypothetical protein